MNKIDMSKMNLDYLIAAGRQCMEDAQELWMYYPDSSEAGLLYEEAREYQKEAERREREGQKMLFKVFKIINPWTRKEEDTGEVVSVNPKDTQELDALARKYDTMYVAAHGDKENPDYLWGFKVFWDDEGFEQYQTDYIFRPVVEEEVR